MAEIAVTKENFDEVVLKSDKPVLLDFWAPWCGPCRMLGPIIEDVAEETEGKAVVGKVNVDEQDELASQFGIMSIPTLVFFKGGKAVKQAIGVQGKDKIVEWLLEL